jgi:hypothetical protein
MTSRRRYVTPYRWILAVLVLAVAAAGLSTLAPASFASRESTPATASQQPREIEKLPKIVIEFELPTGFWQKEGSGAFWVTGFRIGYFRPDDSIPLFTADVGRDAVTVDGDTASLSTPLYQMPGRVSEIVFRLQTMTKATASDWSEPTARVNVAKPAPAVRARAAAKTKTGLTVTTLKEYPQLSSALSALLKDGASTDAILPTFRNVNELALAVAICTDQSIAITQLSGTMQGPPRRSLRNAVRTIKPALRRGDALQKARARAKQLLKKS